MDAVMIPEQEIINAVCIFLADKNYVIPENVMVELLFDDETGFGAEAEINGKAYNLKEVNLIEALRHYLENEHDIDPYSVGLNLEFDEDKGIVCYMN